MTSLNGYLDHSCNNSKVCSAVFQVSANKYSNAIWAVTGISNSLVNDYAESYNFSHPLHIQHDITPEYDVALYLMSEAPL